MPSPDRHTAGEIQWATRVPRELIRRLYRGEAARMIDDDLLDEVGIGLYARCMSILSATEAHRGRIQCPSCGHRIEDVERVRFRTRDVAASCEHCGWFTSWRVILDSIRGKELVAGAAEEYFRDYVRRYPAARTSGEKMILIDTLLHEFHSSARFGDVRPAAVNVIDGRARDVMKFLDELAGNGNTPGQQSWRKRAPRSVFGRNLEARAHRETPIEG